MTQITKMLYRELYKRSFYDFVKDFWSTCEPAKMIDGSIVKIYCEIFQYMCRDWIGYDHISIDVPVQTEDVDVIDVRQNKRNLCLMVPPRHSKSLIFNVMGPTWLWTYHPIKAVSISHTGSLASQMNGKRYAIINSERYKEIFSDVQIVANSTSFIKDLRGGELYSLNRNAFTGYGCDLCANDDLTNAETARKDQAEMANAWSYYQNTMPSRINDINKCIIMNIQQRLAPNDIAGHIMNDEKLAATYIFVTLPAIFEKRTHVVCPISGDIITFEKGDYLWSERFGDYSTLRYQVGESIFQTQYLQKPIASDKTVIKPDMIDERDSTDVPSIDDADVVYASHDFPVKDKETSDFLGSVLAYRVNSTLYVTDCLEKRMAFNKSVDYVRQLDEVYPGCIQVIEDKANGSPILQQLQDEVAGMQAYQPGTASKMQRLESASLYMISHNVVFVRNIFNKLTNQWELSKSLQNLKKRLLDFPFVEHDDITDAFSMLVLFVFMDRRYMVYGRAFNDNNITTSALHLNATYESVFFNKEGDTWKCLRIGVEYGERTRLIVKDECRFKADMNEGLTALREFAPKSKLFIDCSATEALRGIVLNDVTIERYEIADFDKSVAQLNLAFSKDLMLIDKQCLLTKADIESFKFTKSKDDTVKYASTKDGFVACLRMALHYFGGIV